MNNTNRVLNRAFLLVVGIALLGAGVAAVAMATIPAGTGAWRTATQSVGDAAAGAWRDGLPAIGLPQVPWPLAAVPSGALVAIVVLLVFVFAQGRGRRPGIVESEPVASTHDSPGMVPGVMTVDAAVARDVLQYATESIRGVSRATVSAYRVRRRLALKLTVVANATTGREPTDVLSAVEGAVTEWDRTFGRRVPVFVHLTAGPRPTQKTLSRVV